MSTLHANDPATFPGLFRQDSAATSKFDGKWVSLCRNNRKSPVAPSTPCLNWNPRPDQRAEKYLLVNTYLIDTTALEVNDNTLDQHASKAFDLHCLLIGFMCKIILYFKYKERDNEYLVWLWCIVCSCLNLTVCNIYSNRHAAMIFTITDILKLHVILKVIYLVPIFTDFNLNLRSTVKVVI